MSNNNNDVATTTVAPPQQQLTIEEAVTAAINKLKSINSSFSAYDITSEIRRAISDGEYGIPGMEAKQNHSNIKYWISHDAVKNVVNQFLADGTLTNLGMTDVNYNGQFRLFEFAVNDNNDISNDTITDNNTKSTPSYDPNSSYNKDNDVSSCCGGSCGCVDNNNTKDVNNDPITLSIKDKVESFLLNRSHNDIITLKRIQSAIKTNGVTCKDFGDIVAGLGYVIVPVQQTKYSTYQVQI